MDLLIRTGGEQRLSDFLLWECAYAELFFTTRMWPDFGGDDLAAALAEFRGRDRRFGALPESSKTMSAMARPLLLWSVAGALGGLGTGLLFDAAPGLNWGIWTLASAGGVLLCARVGGSRRRGPPSSCRSPSRRASGSRPPSPPPRSFHAVIAGGVAVLLALAVLLAGDPGWEALTAPFMLGLPVAAPAPGGRQRRSGARSSSSVSSRHPGTGPLLRGGLLALPVVGLFALMLANADPVLATLRDDLADALARLAVRAPAHVLRCPVHRGPRRVRHRPASRRSPRPGPGGAGPTPRLADTERLVVLGAVGALFSAFLLLQLSYLFGNARVIPGSGVTFAEYARRGFSGLTTVATLSTILLAGLDHWAARGPARGMDAHRGGRGRRAGRRCS